MVSDTMNRYQNAWESFWGTLTGEPHEVLWNVSRELAVALDFERFKDLIALNNLPLVDVGCGDGTQTRFFSDHVQHTIGVDVSSRAIEIARSQTIPSNLEYRVLDILDKASCQAFHRETGDVNIYMRGVLMQFLPPDRLIAVNNLRLLMGMKGYLYLKELRPETKAYYASIIKEQGMPSGFARVLKHGITPGGISQEDINILFPSDQFEIIREGKHVMNTIIPQVAGGIAKAPAFYMVVKSL